MNERRLDTLKRLMQRPTRPGARPFLPSLSPNIHGDGPNEGAPRSHQGLASVLFLFFQKLKIDLEAFLPTTRE